MLTKLTIETKNWFSNEVNPSGHFFYLYIWTKATTSHISFLKQHNNKLAHKKKKRISFTTKQLYEALFFFFLGSRMITCFFQIYELSSQIELFFFFPRNIFWQIGDHGAYWQWTVNLIHFFWTFCSTLWTSMVVLVVSRIIANRVMLFFKLQ